MELQELYNTQLLLTAELSEKLEKTEVTIFTCYSIQLGLLSHCMRFELTLVIVNPEKA